MRRTGWTRGRGPGDAALCAPSPSTTSTPGWTRFARRRHQPDPIGADCCLGHRGRRPIFVPARGGDAGARCHRGRQSTPLGTRSLQSSPQRRVASFSQVLNAVAWPFSILMFAMSMWVASGDSDRFALQRCRFFLPGVRRFSLGILVVDNWYHVGLPPVVLAAVTLAVAGVRLPSDRRCGSPRATALERGSLPAAVRTEPGADGHLRPQTLPDRRPPATRWSASYATR